MAEQIPVAVIGIGCRFPGGAKDADTLWAMLANGRDVWTEVPKNRFRWASFWHPSPESQGCTNHRGGHFIHQDVTAFDAEFFGIPPLEAKAIDPQQRLLLETTYEAVENAGIQLRSLQGSDTAVYAAAFANDYDRMLSKDMSDITPYHLIGTGNATFANRISYAFDLKGPSMTIDTGCSGSLVALHQACQSLRNFESGLAIAGGAVLMISPDQMITMSQQHILNSDGRCFSFDSRGSGYGRGEGAAMILLKRLDDAVRDGDRVRAIIRNTAVNQDGRTNGITLPSQASQERLAQLVFQGMPFEPSDIQYVEAHGTGTCAGDKVELQAIRDVYCKNRNVERPLIVGSIKPLIGHLESASGVAGVIKTILCMEKGLIPKNLLFQTPKEGLSIDQGDIEIPLTTMPWPSSAKPRRAVVNNFGYGGTNAAVILEEMPVNAMTFETKVSSKPVPYKWHMLQFSANSEASLSRHLEDMQEWIEGERSPDLRNLSYTLSKRTIFPWRQAIIADSMPSLAGAFRSASRPFRKILNSRIIFAFTGQGAQWPTMGNDLMIYPEYIRSIRRSERVLLDLGAEWSLVEELQHLEGSSNIHLSSIAQPATTAIQIALMDLLRSWKIHPDALIGHSSGEIAAAYAAQMISHEAALTISYYRGTQCETSKYYHQTAQGMLAVGLSAQEAKKRILDPDFAKHVTLACINSPISTTLSGELGALFKLKSALDAEGIFTRQLKVDNAYHSPFMSAVASDYLSQLSHLSPSLINPNIELYSTVTAGKVDFTINPEYWVRNLTSPVRFYGALKAMVSNLHGAEHMTIVEVGPHSVLRGPIRETLVNLSPITWEYAPTLIRDQDSARTILEAAVVLFESGADISLGMPPGPPSILIDIPSYHWDYSTPYWHEPRLSHDYRFRPHPPHDLLGLRILTSPEEEPSWRVLLSCNILPWLVDHVIDGFAVFPATAYLTMVTEALRQWKGHLLDTNAQNIFRRVSFKRTLRIPPSPEKVELVLTIRRQSDWGDFRIYSVSCRQWYEHCQGQIQIPPKNIPQDDSEAKETALSTQCLRNDLEYFKSMCHKRVDRPTFYDTLRSLGNDYGQSFSPIQEAFISESKAIAKIFILENLSYPAFTDACLQIAVFLFGQTQKARSIVPVHFDHVHYSSDLQLEVGQVFTVICSLYEIFSKTTKLNITVFQCDKSGEERPVGRFLSGQLRATGDGEVASSEDFEKTVFKMEWNIDPASLTSGYLQSLETDAPLDVKLQVKKLRRLLDIANFFIDTAIEELRKRKDTPVTGLYAPIFQLLARGVDKRRAHITREDGRKEQDVSDLGIEGELLTCIGPSLGSILTGEIDPLSLLLEDQLLYRVYQDDCTKRCNTYLIDYMRHLVFKNPHMRILEIGAGTGGTTVPLFEALGATDRPFSACYDLTDISSGFFEQAKASLKAYSNFIAMRTLDIEEDPCQQGFEEHSYDLIIASNVLHATRRITTTLEHVHKLLKPGGRLAFIELVGSNSMYDMTFGLLPGWWAGVEDGRTNSPLLAPNQWNQRLRQASFTSLDITAFDFSEDARRGAFMVARAKSSSLPNGHHQYRARILNTSDHSHPSQLLVKALFEELAERGYQADYTSWNNLVIDETTSYVILDTHNNPFLAKCTLEEFTALRKLVVRGSKIFWVTFAGPESATQDAGGGLVTGFARTARSEYESLQFITIDIQDYAEIFRDRVCSLITDIITASSDEDPFVDPEEYEYRIQDGKLYIPRIIRSEDLQEGVSVPPVSSEPIVFPFHSPDRLLQLQISSPGILNTLEFVDRKPFSAIGSDEIELRVYAHGINFKDMWVALGQMRPTDNFVGECAGIITNVGEDFRTRFKVGDRVCTLAATPYSSIARANGHIVCKIPRSTTYVTAASFPVAFCTAYYSLIEIAHIQHNQRVLIHAGSGALGQAAIQIAKHFGAEVFTTVSTAEKRRLLISEYNIPDDHIFSSRSVAFKDGVGRLTKGEGVDIALNSLSGEMLHATWECVAEMGTFIEVGKMEIRHNSQLDMTQFDKNTTFSSVDMILLAKRRPQQVQRILESILALLEKGVLRPVSPVTTMPIADVEQAFRLIQAGKHTGKIVLGASADASVPARVQALHLDSQGTYVIVGGLGKFGLQVCKHLKTLGAGNVILLTRKHLVASEKLRLEQDLSSNETNVTIIRCDISKLDEVESTAKEIEKSFPILRGIIQSSMVLQDRGLEQMTLEDFRTSISPKYGGTRNLVEVFRHTDLDFFILNSSLSGIVGTPGQANYAAGNTYQDNITQGGKCPQWKKIVSLDMAVLSDTHLIAQEKRAKLSRRGIMSIPSEAIIPYLDLAMTPATHASYSKQILIGLDMHNASEYNKAFYSRVPMFNHVFVANQNDHNMALSTSSSLKKSAIEELVTDAQRSSKDLEGLIVAVLKEKISSLVALRLDDISIDKPIVNFGLDSLIAIEMKNWATKTFKVLMQTSDILDSPSITSLTALIMQRMEKPDRNDTESCNSKIARTEVTRKQDTLTPNISVTKLPLHSLDDILDAFTNASAAFGTAHERLAVEKVVRDFRCPRGIGHKLHARLLKLANDPNIDCWLSSIYDKTFWLQRRTPLRPAMNFFSSHILTERSYNQADKAAVLTLAAFDLKQRLDTNELPQDVVNDEPQCMESLGWIFNACRRPGAGCDETLRFPGNDYIAVMRNGHIYKVPLTRDGKVIERHTLCTIFNTILQVAPTVVCWASVLTEDDREAWAKTHKLAEEASAANEEYFSVIEKSLFLVCLDNDAPKTSEERVQCFLLDDNRNRWNDKTLSLIVCENGVSAFWCEHSMIDGTTLDQLQNTIRFTLTNDESRPASFQGKVKALEGDDFIYYPFQSSPKINERIAIVRKEYLESIQDVDFASLDLPFGQQYLRKYKLPPKGVLQSMISVAVKLHFGRNPASYEAVSLRSFRKGRMDIYQVHTQEMDAFVSAVCMPSSKMPAKDLRNLLLAATSTHASGIAHTSRGRGWDRQLTALRAVLQPDEPVPELFNDDVWKMMRPRKVFVSFSNTGAPEWGSVWRDREALWIGVEIGEERTKLCISNGLGKATSFGKLVEDAASTVKGIIEGTD